MSIDGIPDLENQGQDSDKSEEKIEIADNSRPEFNKRGEKNFGDIKYKTPSLKSLMK